MALREVDRNRMASKPGDKRKKVEIDLTGESDNDAPQTKTQRRPTQTAYQTPPASSAPSSSQHGGYVYGAPSQSFENVQHSQADRDAWLADDQDDVDELVPSSTQAAAADTELLHHYGSIHGKIVGVRFYNGHANPGEQIMMKRERGNPYDSNAIRVDNVQNTQIGHIPRQMASKLASFMDNKFLHCEGELAGNIGQFDCPVLIRLFGPDPQSEEGVLLAAELKAAKLPLDVLKAAERQRKEAEKARQKAEKDRMIEEKRQLALARRAAAQGGSGSGARIPSGSQQGFASQGQSMPGASTQPVMADILEASERFSPREIGNSTDQYGMQEEQLKNMPSTTQPDAIKTAMLPYQLQALRWLLDQESPQLPSPGAKDAVQLWKGDNRSNLFTNIATTFSVSKPTLASGGILADDMGLGTTLIVAPLSVMSNWSGQIGLHVREDNALSVYRYHGNGRVKMSAEDFSQYDVVITTYQTLATDYMPKAKGAGGKLPEKKLRESGLYAMDWRRVILDEGHTIRNPQSKGAAAVNGLISKSRWVLTGTPIVNSLRDLYSILKFIGISGGLEGLEMFNRQLVRPLKQGDPSATLLLKAIMTAFTLRRRKEMKFVDLRLPELEEYVQRIDFTEKERQRYDALDAEAKGVLNKYKKAQGSGASQTFAHLLEVLLRMRQCCNHWQLCGERVTNLLAQISEAKKTVDLTPKNEKALQDILQLSIESQDDCAICLETLQSHNQGPVITTCAHTFGKDCIDQVVQIQGKCPMCRSELKEEMLVAPKNDCGDETANDDLDLTQSSSKLEEMMKILYASRDSDNKTVIFSQWTRFLDIVQSRLDREGFKYCRIDGTMPAGKRDTSLQSLANDGQCTIMLASLGVCAVGLNLTAANQIILSDTWWAPAIEDQAVDRVHRLGQTKPTRVWRLVMDGTIEEQTIEIQKDKRKLMQLAFSEKGGKRDKAKTGRLADIQRLLHGTKKKPGKDAQGAEGGASEETDSNERQAE